MQNADFEILRDQLDAPVLSLPNSKNTCTPHFHRQMEILYVVSGENLVTVNDTTLVLSAGQMSVADSFDVHSYQSKGDLSICMIIPYAFMQSFINQKNGRCLSKNFLLEPSVTRKFKSLIDILYENWSPEANLFNQGIMTAILGFLLKHIPLVENTRSQSQDLIIRILQYIEENFKNDISLESVAKNFGYNKYYFSKLFNTYLHCHFNEYINMARAKYAIRLMNERKDMPVLHAVLDSGFPSIPTFYRFFKQHYGMSPSEWMRLNNRETLS